MFEIFKNAIIDWLHSLNIPINTHFGLNRSKTAGTHPPNQALLWENYLSLLIPDRYKILLFGRPQVKSWFLSGFTELTPYTIEKNILNIINESILRTLNYAEKEDMVQKITGFHGSLNNWISGSWHRMLTSNPREGLSTIKSHLKFDNHWQCAAFLSRSNYTFPCSISAYNGWLKWIGQVKDSENDSYFSWISLISRKSEMLSEQYLLDQSLDVAFNPDFSQLIQVLCINQASCQVCPVKQGCKFHKNNFSADARLNTISEIKTGNLKSISSHDLLIHLARENWSGSEFEKQLMLEFPYFTNSRFTEVKTDNEEKFLSTLLAIIELNERYQQNQPPTPGQSFTNAEELYLHFSYELKKESQESFYTIILDNKHRILSKKLISLGTLNQSLVHPREVFAPAVQLRAAAIILIHNHPSGDPTPSNQDISVTQRLKDVGEIIGIKILDHIIIGDSGFYSFVDDDLL